MRNKREITFVILLIPFSIGILLASQFPSQSLQSACGYISIILLLILIILNTGYKKFGIYKFQHAVSALLHSLIFCLGMWIVLKNDKSLQNQYFATTKTDYLSVIVDEEPTVKPSYIRFKAEVIAGLRTNYPLTCSGNLLITIKRTPDSKLTLKYGDQVLIPSVYSAVPRVKNDGEFDYAAWLATKNILMQAYIDERYISVTNHHQGSWIKAFAIEIRQQQVDVLRKLILQPEALSVASTLILGFRSELDNDTLAAYSKTGTIHALSVSGMHVGLIYIVLNTLLSFLDRNQIMKLFKALMIIILIWSYAALTGFSPSVLRSALMLTCFIIAKVAQRRSNSYNILCFSAFILLIENPLLIYDVGFQLSYVAVWGLLFIQPIIYDKLTIINWYGDKVWQYVSFSLAAQMATFPLSIYYFHQFPVYFLISNLLLLLPAALMMYIGLAILLFQLHFLAPALAYLIIFTNQMLKWIADQPYATISAIWLNKTELLVLCFLVVFILKCMEELSKKRILITMLLITSFQIMISWKGIQLYNQRRTVTFKVSNHYAKAYLHANHAFICTDLAPGSKAFNYSIKPFLEKNGITIIEIKYTPQQLKKLNHI